MRRNQGGLGLGKALRLGIPLGGEDQEHRAVLEITEPDPDTGRHRQGMLLGPKMDRGACPAIMDRGDARTAEQPQKLVAGLRVTPAGLSGRYISDHKSPDGRKGYGRGLFQRE